MASTFSTNLAIELIGTGDQAGTWGTTTNSNLGTLIEQSISGYVTQAVATGTDTTITIPNGSTGVARNMYIELTGTGGASTNLIVPANKKLYFIFNNSTGAVTVKVSGQTGVSVPTGKKMVLVSNGTDIVNGLNYIADFGTNSFSVTNLTASSATITNLIATSGSITNLVSSDASATVLRAGSATLTHLSATSATITNLTLTSLVISNLSIASANITTLTGTTATFTSGTVTNLNSTSANITTLTGTTFGTTATTQLRGASGQITTLTSTSANITTLTSASATITNLLATSLAVSGIATFAAGSAAAPSITTTGDTNTGLFFPAADTIAFTEGGAESMRIDSSGNVAIGTASPASTSFRLYVESLGGILTSTASNVGSTSPTIGTSRRRTSLGSVNSGDSLGKFSGFGWDGTSFVEATRIESYVDGPPSTNDMPGRLVFNTTADGASTPTERMRLDSSGNLGIGTASPAQRLHISTATTYQGILINGNQAPSVCFATSTNTTPAWKVGLSGNNSANFAISSGAAATDAVTIDSSGNLGLGVTPSAWNSAHKVIDIGTYGSVDNEPAVNGFNLVSNGYYNASNQWIYKNTAAASLLRLSEGGFKFFTAASGTAGNQISLTQAMTLDVSGNLLVGTTNVDARLAVTGPGNSIPVVSSKGTTSGDTTIQHYQLIKYDNDSTTGQVFVKFYINQGNSACGQINANGANQAAFGSTSDQRVKENIADLPSQLSNIMALRPVEFDYVESYGGGHQIGFVAQEMQLIYPDVVSENKTSEKIMSITGWSKTEARLVKAIQEQQAIITALTARITALESK